MSTTFNQKREAIVREILDNYHYDTAIAITGDRGFINHSPPKIERLHNAFAYLAIVYVAPEAEEEHIRKLKRVRNALKIEYAILKLMNKSPFRLLHRDWRTDLYNLFRREV